jgi:hypothetical protein
MQISGADNPAHHIRGDHAASQARSAHNKSPNANGANRNTKAIASYENHAPASTVDAVNAVDQSIRPVPNNRAGQAQSLYGLSQLDSAARQRHASSGHSYRPDNTAHVARNAIAAYTSTQYIEERNHFTEVLGVDEYA